MMKNYNLKTVWVLLICVVFTSNGQNISFKVDLSDTNYPAAGADIRIGGNANATGWTSSKVLLTDDDNDKIWTGTYKDIPLGDFLFRVYEGTGAFGSWGGDWITDVTNLGCVSSGANYSYTVTADTNVTISLKLNECYTVEQGTLSYQSFDLVDFSVYPNPAEDYINVQTPNGASAVTIYDLVGNKVLENKNYQESASLDISGLVSGIYIVIVESNGSKGMSKLVKK